MAVEQNFSIRRGRTEQIIVTVDTISDWTNLLAKLFAYSALEESSIVFALTGTIDAVKNTITFAVTHDITKGIEESSLYYEVTVYKNDKSYIEDTTYGLINLEPVGKIDPTI